MADVFTIVFSGLCLFAQSKTTGNVDVLVLNANYERPATDGESVHVHTPVLFFKTAEAQVSGAKPVAPFKYKPENFTAERYDLPRGETTLSGGDGKVNLDYDNKVIDLSAGLGSITSFGFVNPAALKPGYRVATVFHFAGNGIAVKPGGCALDADAKPLKHVFKALKSAEPGEAIACLADTIDVTVPLKGNTFKVGAMTVTPKPASRIHVHNLPPSALSESPSHDMYDPDRHFQWFYDVMLGDPRDLPVPHPVKEAHLKKPDEATKVNNPVCPPAAAQLEK